MFRRKAHNRVELPIEELKRLYWDENLSSEEIARRFNCDGLTVLARLRENDIPLKPRGWHKLVRHVPDSLLDAWPSPELAYVVGLVASDGNLQKQNHCVIEVSTDNQIINLIGVILQLSKPQVTVVRRKFPNKTAYMLQVCDYRFRAFLEGLGLTPKKTFTIGPLAIPDQVFRDFLRGELDGDGSWYVSKGWRDSKYLVGKFTSRSQIYLEWLQQSVSRLSGTQGALQPSRLFYNSKKAEALGEWLYYDTQLPCLSRKRQVWENWMNR